MLVPLSDLKDRAIQEVGFLYGKGRSRPRFAPSLLAAVVKIENLEPDGLLELLMTFPRIVPSWALRGRIGCKRGENGEWLVLMVPPKAASDAVAPPKTTKPPLKS